MDLHAARCQDGSFATKPRAFEGRIMPRAVLLPFLLLAASCGGCIEMYEATGTCTYCENGKKKVVPIATPTGTQYCTNENAELELDRTCQELNPDGVVTNVTVGRVSVLDVGQCGDDRQPAGLAAQTGFVLNPWLAALQTQPVAEADVPLTEESCSIGEPEKQIECDCLSNFDGQVYVERSTPFCGECSDPVQREFSEEEVRFRCEVGGSGGVVVSDYRCVEVPDGPFCPPIVTRDAPTAMLKPIPDPKFAAQKR
jgi:hypothetical protein